MASSLLARLPAFGTIVANQPAPPPPPLPASQLVQEHDPSQPARSGVEPPEHVALHEPRPHSTSVPSQDAGVSRHSMEQVPFEQRKDTSPQPSTPSQTSLHEYVSGHVMVLVSHASPPMQMTTQA
jgi:hypothetical protein